jgi:hypothetical protein
MTQPGLIESILADLNLLHNSKTKETPSLGILYPDRDGIPRQNKCSYLITLLKIHVQISASPFINVQDTC